MVSESSKALIKTPHVAGSRSTGGSVLMVRKAPVLYGFLVKPQVWAHEVIIQTLLKKLASVNM